jgi:acetyltransferase-like isoleucine patch superfamily enzyme
MASGLIKAALAAPLVAVHRALAKPMQYWYRLRAFSGLQAALAFHLPATTVILGPAQVYGSGRVRCGEGLLIYPHQYWETWEDGEISIGDGVVLSSGVHLVSYAGISIGKGTMIGEYVSIRDANHTREAGMALRDSSHVAKPITIGNEVWIGRGVAVLSGVTIGNGATIGANAVVTRDVPAGAVVAGVPAVPIQRRAEALPEMRR